MFIGFRDKITATERTFNIILLVQTNLIDVDHIDDDVDII